MRKIKYYVGNLIKNMNQDVYDDIQDFLMFQTYKRRKKMSISEYPDQLKKDFETYRGGIGLEQSSLIFRENPVA